MIADPDATWQQVRALEAAWDGLLRRVAAGELTADEGSERVRELLWSVPVEVLAMGSRWLILRHELRQARGEREG